MKAKQTFILRQIVDEYLLIPVGAAAQKINGLIGLSESGALLFRRLQTDCTAEELVALLLKEYDVSAGTAEADVADFLKQMRRLGILEENTDCSGM